MTEFSSIDPNYPLHLRKRAESLLSEGNTVASSGHFLYTDALTVLFKLASSRESASDGLKLLHELQTYQIELDLQREQHEIKAREMSTELDIYRDLFEFAPVAYFIISREGRIIMGNQAGAALFGVDRSDLEEHTLARFLSPASLETLNWQREKLFRGSPCEKSTIMAGNGHETRPLYVMAQRAPEGDRVLMTISEQWRP